MSDYLMQMPEGAIAYTVRTGTAKRKRMAVRVTRQGQVLVLLPKGYALEHAEQMVRKNSAWIFRQVAKATAAPFCQVPDYVSGATHWYLGTAMKLDVLVSRAWQGVTVTEDRLVVSARKEDPQSVGKVLKAWYKQKAQVVFAERVQLCSDAVPWLAHPPVWKMKTLRSRWGSCSAQGVIVLNTRLVKTPLVCIDYVIMHEIVHLRELNHSAAFYAELDARMPHWQERRTILRSFEARILPSSL